MSNSAQGLLDPYKMAKRHQSVQGEIALKDMVRANKLLATDDGAVEYSLKFAEDADGICVISGELSGAVTVCCQRCMQNFVQLVHGEFKLSPVVDDKATKLLANDYEPVLLADGKFDPNELLEDELILALPIVAMHQEGSLACKTTASGYVESRVQEPEVENPFQVLQTLKVKTLKLNKNGHQPGDE